MNPGYSTENPRDFLEAYARIDKFADTCVFKENFADGLTAHPKLLVINAGWAVAIWTLKEVKFRSEGAHTNSMFIDYPRFLFQRLTSAILMFDHMRQTST